MAAANTNITTNVQSGVVYGWAGLVDGIVGRMKEEMGGLPTVAATGGLVSLIAGVATSIQHVNVDLKLEGLRLLWERSGGFPH